MNKDHQNHFSVRSCPTANLVQCKTTFLKNIKRKQQSILSHKHLLFPFAMFQNIFIRYIKVLRQIRSKLIYKVNKAEQLTQSINFQSYVLYHISCGLLEGGSVRLSQVLFKMKISTSVPYGRKKNIAVSYIILVGQNVVDNFLFQENM